MITSVAAKGLKGLPDFETKIERLTLLYGPNGAGKTARTHAMQLAILGYVPGLAKTNRDIMDTFGNGERLIVEVRRNGVRCSRGYFANNEDKVTEKFQLDLKRATRDQYAVALGGVKLFDLGAFQKLSDQGKIDQVFALFPPGEDYREMDSQIEARKAERNALQKSLDTLQATQARLHQSRATIDLPVGTLAEIKSQIQEKETQLSMVRQLLVQNKINFAKLHEREQAEAKAEQEAEQERLRVAERQRLDRIRLEAQERLNAEMADKLMRSERSRPDIQEVVTPSTFLQYALNPTLANAIESILETMQRTGCGACAAALVCKRELKKLREAA